jgi:polysaccharide pyruvyl transferase WcaK-like protein
MLAASEGPAIIERRSSRTVSEKAHTTRDAKPKKIGLFDHMGFGNMGDAAVHESFIQNIKDRLPNARLVAFSQNPNDTTERHKLESYPIRWHYPGWNGPDRPAGGEQSLYSGLKSRLQKRCGGLYRLAKHSLDLLRKLRHLKRSWDVVRSLDILVMAGGGQLCDLWPDLPYNVWKFCLLARLSNTPVFIVGVGADQLERPSSKLFAKWAVGLANYCSLRDRESQTLVRNLGVKTETHVCPDPAYAVDFHNYVRDRPSHTLTPKVGLNPMGYCDSRMWPRKDDAAYNRYLEKLAQFSSWLLAQNYSLELFTSDIGVDKYALDDLKR